MTDYPNWFNVTAKANFERFLLPEAGKPNLNYLQLGAFTGDASVWLLDNILTHEYSSLTDVDTWEGAENEPIQEEMNFANVYATYVSKVNHRNSQHYIMTSQEYLLAQRLSKGFDFIYVDAHHTAASAFLDSELSWPLLKSQGILAIDDYEWLHPDGVDIHAPKLGIHMFLDRHTGEYDELVRNQQVWIRKR